MMSLFIHYTIITMTTTTTPTTFGRHSSELYQEENVVLWMEIANFRTGQYAAPRMGTALEVGEVIEAFFVDIDVYTNVWDVYCGCTVRLRCDPTNAPRQSALCFSRGLSDESRVVCFAPSFTHRSLLIRM